MDAFYLDSSALVKRYVSEVGTAWVTTLCDPLVGNTIYAARITLVEVTAALARRVRGASLSAADDSALMARFQSDFLGGVRIVELAPGVVTRAVALSQTYALRGYDAVQLASALEINVVRLSLSAPALTFVSADSELNTAAVSEGLVIDDPNRYP